jgi:predicted MFS family arabinose efflux permease
MVQIIAMSTDAPATEAESRNLWVGLMSLAQLISWGSLYYTFSLLMPVVEQDLGASRVEVSGAFSAALLASGLGGLVVGRLIDRGHARAVMSIGSIGAGLLLLAHSRVTSVAALYAVWIGLGIVMACILYEPVFTVLIRRWPKDYRRSLIAMTFLGGLASTVFIPLSAWMIERLGWRETCLVLAAMHFFLCLPIHLWMLRDEPPARREVGRDAASAGEPNGSVASVRELATSPAFLLITVFSFVFMGLSAALSAHMVPLLRERGLPAAWAVAVPASIGVMQVLGRLVLFVFEGRIDPKKLDLIIPLLMPLSLLLLLAGGGSTGAALAFAACFGVGNGLITIVKATAIAAYVSRDRVAVLSGLQTLPGAVARACGPIMLAALWTVSSSYTAGLWLLIVAGVVATGLLAAAQKRALPQS